MITCQNRNTWVMDIETLKSCFTYTAINIDTQVIVQYVIHKECNELNGLIDHLNDCKGHIGFNNVNFDYPIIHYILKNKDNFNYQNPQMIVDLIYKKAQQVIESQDSDEFYKTVAIPQKQWLIPQLDLFKLWHYNNKARSTSLKALQISMNYPNVMEMPIEHTKEDITVSEVEDILRYNLNDVLSTYEFYKKSLEKIELRKFLKKTYNIPCTNFPDVKLGEQLVLKLYCDETGEDFWEVKEWRTKRESINLKECILPEIEFESPSLNKLLEDLKDKIITKTKDAFSYSVPFSGIMLEYGTGGIHACTYPGIYQSDNEYVIKSCDVALKWRK